ncbi:MAG: TonB-dependent receptor, partial [Alistipes dispar]
MKHVLVLLLSLFSLCAAPTAADAGARTLPDSVAATARTEERRPCVRGRVEDTEGRPVLGVAVVMLDADSAYVAAAASDAEGRFEIVPAVKPYRLLFQHISYELAALSGASGEAGTVTLHERSTGIGAVVVEGERPVVRIEQGRLAYDLQAVVRGKAVNNAYEALTQLPGVSERQGTLTLAGTGSVTVILNGRPTTMDAAQLEALLRSTPVERIEKAEIMYSAPPQYHVRGAAINLVMRRAAAGTLTGEVHGDYSNRYYGNWEAGGNLVFAAREWSADITYSAGQTRSKRLIDLLSRHTLADGTYDIEQHQDLVSETTAHRLRASAEYAPENKGRVSAAYTASFTPRNAGDSRAEGNFVRSSNRPDGDA